MKRVLVTGATGYIGMHAIEPLLEKGYEVHAIHLGRRLPNARVQWHEADLFDERRVSEVCAEVGASHLLHFAWYVSHADYKTSSENDRWVGATLSLIEAFKKNGGTRAALAGTCMEYDWSIPQEYLSETGSPILPTTPYGRAKNDTRVAAERFAAERGLSLAWGRIFYLFGPGGAPTRVIPYVITSLLKNEPALVSSGKQIRDMMYTKDAADAFVALLDSSVTGVVNIGSGEPIALKDVMREVAAQLGKPELLRLGAKQDSEEPERLVPDVKRLFEEVGWKPHRTRVQGLEETIAWWKTNTR